MQSKTFQKKDLSTQTANKRKEEKKRLKNGAVDADKKEIQKQARQRVLKKNIAQIHLYDRWQLRVW